MSKRGRKSWWFNVVGAKQPISEQSKCDIFNNFQVLKKKC